MHPFFFDDTKNKNRGRLIMTSEHLEELPLPRGRGF